jgi:hypothetical protein
LIAEDTFILRSLPILISRLVDLEGDPVECRRMNGKPDFIANFWKIVKEFQFRYPAMHKVLAVCDADNDCVVTLADKLRERAIARLGALRFPLVFHVITQELETWWIAESAAISLTTGVAIPFPGGNVEQDVLDPKAYIVRRLAVAKGTYTYGDAAATAAAIDLTTLRDRCPGFVRFARRVVNDPGA